MIPYSPPAILALILLALCSPAALGGEPSLTQQIQSQVNADGSAELPRGFFEATDTIVIRRRSGVSIDGAGRHLWPEHYTGGWNGKGTMQGTHILYTGPADKPAVLIEDSHSITISNLTIRCQNNGTAIKVQTGKWGGNNCHTFDRLHLHTDGTHVECGGGDRAMNAADLDFRACTFRGDANATAFRCLDGQNVGYQFFGCYFFKLNTICHLVQGGNVRFFACDANEGIRTVARIDSVGPNVSPSVSIYGMRIDRSGTTARPRIFDLSRVQSSGGSVYANGVSVIRRAEDRGREPLGAVVWPTEGTAKLRVTAINNALNGVIAWDDRVRDWDKASIITRVETIGGDE